MENRPAAAKGERRGSWMDREFGVRRCKPLYIELMNNKVVLDNTGNYTQYPVINHKGKRV